MRLAQKDLLDSCLNARYEHALTFPDDYWPRSPEPPSLEAWNASVEDFKADRRKVKELVSEAAVDLFATVPAGQGQQTHLRAVLLVADHNAYHLGQLVACGRRSDAGPDEGATPDAVRAARVRDGSYSWARWRARTALRYHAPMRRPLTTLGLLCLLAVAAVNGQAPAPTSNRTLTAVAGPEGRPPHADRAPDRVHGRPGGRRRRGRRRVAAGRRARHARDGSARSDEIWSTRSTPSCCRWQCVRARRGTGVGAISRRAQHRARDVRSPRSRSCRRRSCSICRSAATRRSGRPPTAATGPRKPPDDRDPWRKATSARAPAPRSARAAAAAPPMKAGIGSAQSRCRTASLSAHSSPSTPSVTSSTPPPGRSSPACATPTVSCADARKVLRAGAQTTAPACRGKHDDRRGGDQREPDEGAGSTHGADGGRRPGASDLSVAHDRRRRHGVLRWPRAPWTGNGRREHRSAHWPPTCWPKRSCARRQATDIGWPAIGGGYRDRSRALQMI